MSAGAPPEPLPTRPAADEDVVHALDAVLRQGSAGARGFPLALPAALLHQAYDVLGERRARADVDAGASAARARGVLRLMRLETGRPGDVLVVRESEYADLARRALGAAERDPAAARHAGALREFVDRVLPERRDLFVPEAAFSDPDHARELALLGFLVRKVDAASAGAPPALWFSVPMLGVFVRELVAGRKALVACVARGAPGATRGELLRGKLPKSLRGSSVAVDWHVRDALGGGMLECRDSGIEGRRSLLCLPSPR